MTERSVDPEESECERLLLAGDPEAVPRMLKRFNRPLFSFLYHKVRDRTAAEDLLQEVFVRVWRGRERFEARGNLAGWLFTIARRLCIDHSEKAARRRTESLEAPAGDGRMLADRIPDPAASPERSAEGASARRQIEEAVAALPEEQREVFLMREYGGMSFKQIAETTGVPLGTALARMRYAVLKLRKVLEGALA